MSYGRFDTFKTVVSAGWQFSYKISLLPVYRQDTLDSQALPYYFHTFTHDVISNLYERDTFDRNIVLICARSSERYVCKSIRMKENFEKKLNRLNALQSVQGFSIELLMQEFRVLFRFSSSVERFENDLHRKLLSSAIQGGDLLFHSRMRYVSFYSRRAEIETFEIRNR